MEKFLRDELVKRFLNGEPMEIRAQVTTGDEPVTWDGPVTEIVLNPPDLSKLQVLGVDICDPTEPDVDWDDEP